MRFYYDNKFRFLGFSYNMSMFGVLAGVVALIGAILIILVFLPLYPLWYYLAMKNWDKLAVTNPRDIYFHFSGVKPRVFDMTRGEWKMLLVTWVLAVIMSTTTSVLNQRKETRQKEIAGTEILNSHIQEDDILVFPR